MATANFKTTNAQNYYVIFDTETSENEDGEMVTYERDEWDIKDILSNIRNNGKQGENPFPYECEGWNRDMDAQMICDNNILHQFGKGRLDIANVSTASTIYLRCGYYTDAVLDYDILLSFGNDYNYSLSEFGNTEDLIDSVISAMKEHMEWIGSENGCNLGTFKIQEKNIKKYLEKIITNEIEKCEKFCKENCEKTYVVSARFSNGETWYTEVA